MISVQQLFERVTYIEKNYVKFTKIQAKKEYKFLQDHIRNLGNANRLATKALSCRLHEWMVNSMCDEKKPYKKVKFK